MADGDGGQSLAAADRAHGSAPGRGRPRRPRPSADGPPPPTARWERVDEARARGRLGPDAARSHVPPADVGRRRPSLTPFLPPRRRRLSRRAVTGPSPPPARLRRVGWAVCSPTARAGRVHRLRTLDGRRDPMATLLHDLHPAPRCRRALPSRRASDARPCSPAVAQVQPRAPAASSCPSPRTPRVLERGPVRGGREPSLVYGSLRLEPRPKTLERLRLRQRRPRRRSPPCFGRHAFCA